MTETAKGNGRTLAEYIAGAGERALPPWPRTSSARIWARSASRRASALNASALEV